MAPSISRIAYSLMALLLTTKVTSAPSRLSENELNALMSTLDCVREVLPTHAICMEAGRGHQRVPAIEELITSISLALWDPSCPEHTPVDNLNDAYAQAEWAINQCSQHLMDGGVDLRRVKGRADKPAETTEAEETTKVAHTKGGPKTTLTAATTEPEPETTTTEAAKTTQPTATTDSALTTSTQATTQSTTTTGPSTATSRATTSSALKPSECFTTSMQSITTCPIIATGVHSGRVGSCFPTTIPTSVCAEGLICNSDADGNPSCMYAQNNLGVAGVIMAIFFAATVGVTASLIVFFSCREKRSNKKWAKIMEAEMIARETASAKAPVRVQEVGAGQEGQEDGRPLMGDANGGYGQDPFRDEQRMR